MDIIEESAYDSNGEGHMNPQLQQYPTGGMQPHLQHQSAGKKKKGPTVKASKKKAGMSAPKTNNFMGLDQ